MRLDGAQADHVLGLLSTFESDEVLEQRGFKVASIFGQKQVVQRSDFRVAERCDCTPFELCSDGLRRDVVVARRFGAFNVSFG